MASRRNSALKIYVNGRVADGFYGLSKRVGQTVSRMSVASQRAQASLARRVQPLTKREVRKVYGIKASALTSRMRLETGTRKQSDYLSIWASTRKLPLIDFGGSWGGRRTRRVHRHRGVAWHVRWRSEGRYQQPQHLRAQPGA